MALRRGLRFLVETLVLSCALIRSSLSQFNLLLNENETQRLFSFPCEMYYVRNDQIRQNAFRFIQLPFSINELYFTWFTERPNDPIHYKINVTSTNSQAFLNPFPNLALEGVVPHNRSEFRVDFACTGNVTGEFLLEIEFSISSIQTPFKLSRRKMCFRRGTSRYLEAFELSKLNFDVVELSHSANVLAKRNSTTSEPDDVQEHRFFEHFAFLSDRLINYLLQDNRKRLTLVANIIYVFSIVALIGILAMIVRRRFTIDQQFLKEISLIGTKKRKRRQRKKNRTKNDVLRIGRSAEKNGTCSNGIQMQQLNALLEDISSTSTSEDDPGSAFCDSDSSDSTVTKGCYQHFAYVQRTVAEPWSYMSEIQVAGNRVKILELLLSGTFSRVFHAILLDDSVSLPTNEENLLGKHVLLKTVTLAAHRDQVSIMLQNATLLMNVNHPHINAVCAAAIIDASTISKDGFQRFVTETEQTNVPCLLYPYADVGNLKLFLAELRLPESRRQRYTLTTAHIVNLATQLCKAVNYLHRAHIIHKDIATRNCLINSNLVVKLTDGALSRDLFPDDYSCIGDNENRPVKWLALEALIERKFSTATDVWSFGVTLWELITRAQEPYFDIDAFEIIVFLRDGRRLEKPKNCPDDLYDIMMSCWLTNPENRPTPAFILNKLKRFAVQIGSADHLNTP